MYGSFLLIAFILGFWCIWSASRDVNSLGEALGFTVLAMVIKATMEWSGMPDLDAQLLTTWGILYLFTVVVLEGSSWRNICLAKRALPKWQAG